MKYNKLYRWFLTLMMSLPIISIAVRCIYVQKNENAYMSYSDNTYQINEKIETTDIDNLVEDTTAYLILKESETSYTKASYRIGFSSFTINNTTYTNGYFSLGAVIGTRDGYYITFFDNSLTRINYYSINDYIGTYEFHLTTIDRTAPAYYFNNLYGNSIAFYVLLEETNKLDNAFEYSVNEFNNVGFNKVNFTRWFTDLFTNGDNIYTTFINSYCNYVLFSTCVLALPYFLYWFITFIMGLMDRFGRKEIMR